LRHTGCRHPFHAHPQTHAPTSKTYCAVSPEMAAGGELRDHRSHHGLYHDFHSERLLRASGDSSGRSYGIRDRRVAVRFRIGVAAPAILGPLSRIPHYDRPERSFHTEDCLSEYHQYRRSGQGPRRIAVADRNQPRARTCIYAAHSISSGALRSREAAIVALCPVCRYYCGQWSTSSASIRWKPARWKPNILKNTSQNSGKRKPQKRSSIG